MAKILSCVEVILGIVLWTVEYLYSLALTYESYESRGKSLIYCQF